MKYQTKRESIRPLSLAMFAIGMFYVYAKTSDRLIHGDAYFDLIPFIITMILVSLITGGFFIYSFTANIKRNWFKRKGIRYDGRVVGAEIETHERSEDVYFLRIEFTENGSKKVRLTEGYVGDPSRKLRSLQCDIYELNGKYMEANFNVRKRKESMKDLYIPISKHKMSSRKKNEYV